MKDVTPRRPRHRSPLLMGLALILVGALLLLANLGFSLPPGLWSYWPLGLIALGVIGMVAPTRHLRRSSGIWMLAAGLYCQISVLNLFDLGWSSAWPIFIIAAGLSVIVDPKEAYCPPDVDKTGGGPGEWRQGAS
jgi:hypothetical protein